MYMFSLIWLSETKQTTFIVFYVFKLIYTLKLWKMCVCVCVCVWRIVNSLTSQNTNNFPMCSSFTIVPP